MPLTRGTDVEGLGLGLYTLREAAGLVHEERRTLKRWLFGYDYTARAGEGRARHHSDPLWRPQHAAADLGEPVIGFRDLLELRVVREFVQRGVPLIVIRRCLDTARELFGGDYPLTRQRFVTDGATLFHEALKHGEAEGHMLNLRTRQYVFREIVKDSLYAGIEYEGEYARRWYPAPRSRAVVLDPSVQFGHPVLTDSGVPTASIYASFVDEGRNKARVARLFEVDPRAVDAAVRFEERLRQAA